MHSQTHSHTSCTPLTPACLILASCLLQLFGEFLQTSLSHFLIAPDDTLLIFSLLLFSQESDCSSFPVWWFIGTVRVPGEDKFEELYLTSVVWCRYLQSRFVILLMFWVFHISDSFPDVFGWQAISFLWKDLGWVSLRFWKRHFSFTCQCDQPNKVWNCLYFPNKLKLVPLHSVRQGKTC